MLAMTELNYRKLPVSGWTLVCFHPETTKRVFRWKPVKQLANTLALVLLLSFSVVLHAQVNISVDGVSKSMEENILAHFGKLSKEDLGDKDQLSRRVAEVTRKASRALGYYNAEVTYTIKKNRLRLTVDPGKPVRLSEAEIKVEGEGAGFPSITQFLDQQTFQRGDILSHDKYEQFKRMLLRICQSNGYMDAAYSKNILLVNLQDLTAQVQLLLDTGHRYKIGSIRFEGSDLDEDLLLRLTPFVSGEEVETEQLLLFRRNLLDSNYFQSAVVNQERTDDYRVNLLVHLLDSKQHQYDVGLGYSTDTGPRAKFRWEQPQLNSRGHSSHVEANISKIQQEITGRYVIPLREPLRHFLQFDTGYQRKDVEDTKTELISVGTLLTHIDEDEWRTDYSLDIDNETSKVGEQPTTEVLYMIPGVAWSRTMLPAGIDPLSGSRYWIGLSTSGEALGSDTNFFKAHGLVKWLVDLGNNNSLLTVRFEGGAIATDDIFQVPVLQRFFTGGDQTVRGYSFESLAPRNENDDLVGGRFLNVGSLELSHRFADAWRGALFVDTGRAYNDSSDNFSTGVGAGVRWLSPIGQIRFDLAFPLDQDENDDKYQIHISMGPPL